MRDTILRPIADDERNILYHLIDAEESNYRVKIILLKDEGYMVPEIRRATNHHDTNNIRKWIHRFNEKGIEGIVSRKNIHSKPVKITVEIEKKIVEIATKDPRKDYGLSFSTWSLRVLAGYISKELNLVDSISHTEIRNILLKHEIKYHRQSKITPGNSSDPEYYLKKSELKN